MLAKIFNNIKDIYKYSQKYFFKILNLASIGGAKVTSIICAIAISAIITGSLIIQAILQVLYNISVEEIVIRENVNPT